MLELSMQYSGTASRQQQTNISKYLHAALIRVPTVDSKVAHM